MRPEFARSRKHRLTGPNRPPCRLQRHWTGERDPAPDSPAVTTQPPLAAHIGADPARLRPTPRLLPRYFGGRPHATRSFHAQHRPCTS